MRISTRSGPYSAIKDARSDAQDGSGVSRVPRNASVRIDTLSSGLSCSARFMVSTSSNSVLPIYSVDRYILLCEFLILL
jgi:hypothetical protein